LPTLGVLRVAPPSRRRVTTVETDAGGEALAVDGLVIPLTETMTEPSSGPAWLPLRFIETAGWRVALDDIDPLRSCFETRPAKRQCGGKVAEWQSNLATAWAFLEREDPVQACALAAGIRSITPLKPTAAPHASATNRHAFGAVGISKRSLDSDSGVDLARLLVHEFQHLKLGGVLDMYELHDGSDTERYKVGWRPELRPFEAALQGAYAHIGEAEIWKVMATQSNDESDGSAETCRSLRLQVRDAIGVLEASSSLTSIGHRWMDGMRSTSQSWSEDMAVRG
jgi:uncharacterized protein